MKFAEDCRNTKQRARARYTSDSDTSMLKGTSHNKGNSSAHLMSGRTERKRIKMASFSVNTCQNFSSFPERRGNSKVCHFQLKRRRYFSSIIIQCRTIDFLVRQGNNEICFLFSDSYCTCCNVHWRFKRPHKFFVSR